MKFQILIYGLFLLLSCSSKLSSQDILDNLSKEMCECIALGKYKNSSEISPCYDKLLKKHRDLIEDFYNTSELTEQHIYDFNNKIAAKTIVNNCDYIKKNFPTGIVAETRTKQSNIVCEDLKEGNFYYLTQRPNVSIQDTTFVTISKSSYIEKMRNKTTFSRCKIIWKDDCKYDLIFEESDDSFKKEMVMKGEVFSYEIIANEKESFFVKIKYREAVYQYEIFKIN